MNEARLNLGVVRDLEAESFGEPGSRTFRIRAVTDSGEVSIWLEKEQMVALAGAVEQILERIPAGQGDEPRPVTASASVSGDIAAHAGSMTLGFDATQNGFALEAFDLWEATLEVDRVTLVATRAQLEEIEDQLDEIIAGGRPRCPMCGRPLGPGPHFCPPSNGHAPVLDEGRA